MLARSLRIVIPGGTGYLGTILARHFHEQGHIVSSITRFPKPFDWEAIHWDTENLGHWVSSFEDADVVINLAGRSMNCRYTTRNKRTILESRVRTTRLVGQGIRQCFRPPRVWLNASTVDFYPNLPEVEMDESFKNSDQIFDFGAGLAKSWEAAAGAIALPRTRTVVMRLAPVMNPERGGSFDNLLRLVRWGCGGEMGTGDQYVAWIHDFDFIRAIEFIIQCDDLEGAINLTDPLPVPNHEFMQALRQAWCTSYFGLSAPAWLVKAVSHIAGIEPERVLKSRRVIPSRLLRAGFDFHFPAWRGASENLLERWRQLEPN